MEDLSLGRGEAPGGLYKGIKKILFINACTKNWLFTPPPFLFPFKRGGRNSNRKKNITSF